MLLKRLLASYWRKLLKVSAWFQGQRFHGIKHKQVQHAEVAKVIQESRSRVRRSANMYVRGHTETETSIYKMFLTFRYNAYYKIDMTFLYGISLVWFWTQFEELSHVAKGIKNTLLSFQILSLKMLELPWRCHVSSGWFSQHYLCSTQQRMDWWFPVYCSMRVWDERARGHHRVCHGGKGEQGSANRGCGLQVVHSGTVRLKGQLKKKKSLTKSESARFF